ncbi:J domain-containing protein [Planktothrix agardhii]|uniref:J domain-containing protein n=1 Tax=Planktothrix agardhii TaxID=1160 RepID=UPI000402D977|nr:J domain-containing protein [Planktothrix agardhii]
MEIEKYYKILDLKPGVSLEEVRQAYRHLALIWHPDRYPQNSLLQIQAEAKFKEISHAYETLKTHLSYPTSPAPPTFTTFTPPPTPPTSPTSPTSPTIPLGWLTGVFVCYTLIAWILITLKIPFWVWIFGLIAWFTITLVASKDSDSSQPWLISLMFAGAIAGWVLGKETGGVITATVWGMVGIGLGAIAGSETASKSVIGLLTVMGIAAIAGLIAGTRRGNWLGSVFGGGFGVIMGLMLGIILDAIFQSRAKLGTGSLFGLLLGGWIGAGIGAGQKAIMRVIEQIQPELIIAAWGAIALVAGVVAQMVAGEKLLASYNGFYTFLILGIISGLGFSFGLWLAY